MSIGCEKRPPRPHLRPSFSPNTRPDCGGGAVLAGINRFLPDSIFIYLSLSEGCYRHRDPSARAHARDVKPGQSVSFPCISNQARVSAARVKNDRVCSPKGPLLPMRRLTVTAVPLSLSRLLVSVSQIPKSEKKT